jgi:hypothetical protein
MKFTVRGPIELIEEAVHLLRRAPIATLAMYYIGSLPFVVGLLYFWAEMSTSPFANRHLAGESLALAALFLWMKVWQARFARSLWGQIGGERSATSNPSDWWNVLVSQSALQVSGLLLLPAALVVLAPFGWVYAFYQNVTVAGPSGETGRGSEAGLSKASPLGMLERFKIASKHTLLWPWQNHVLLGILLAFGLFVFLNWTIVCLSLPALAKTFFGVETVFTRSVFTLLNSTFFAAMLSLTYLSMDPLIKAIYTLRCFYGEAQQSGQDLRAELKELRRAASFIVVVAIFFAFALSGNAQGNLQPLGYSQPPIWGETSVALAANLGPGIPVPAETGESGSARAVTPSAAPVSSVPASDLDKEIGRVMEQRKYIWRFPRDTENDPAQNNGTIARFVKDVGEMLRQWGLSARDWVKKILQKMQRPSSKGPNSGAGWMVSPHFLLYVLMVAVLATIAVLLYRLFGKRAAKQAPILTQAIKPEVDLLDENVSAEQLPEDSWTAMGRELLQRGELRLAVRAFYLASLAHLAARNLIHLARFKSNRDYARELERRAHSFPRLPGTFSDNVMLFDRVWYGMHEITPDAVNQFISKVEVIKAA